MADLVAPIDKDIVGLVNSLVAEGISDVAEVLAHIRLKVQVMFKGRQQPDLFNRRFFPSRRDIRELIYRAKIKARNAKNDLSTLEEVVAKLEGEVQFRPPGQGRFLFVHQTEWQKALLNRYGAMVFLDGTYKTTKYTIPLYLLCVKTNVSYVPVASVFIQQEDTDSILEALEIIKVENPSWQPRVVMLDCDVKEEVAIRQLFPGKYMVGSVCEFNSSLK